MCVRILFRSSAALYCYRHLHRAHFVRTVLLMSRRAAANRGCTLPPSKTDYNTEPHVERSEGMAERIIRRNGIEDVGYMTSPRPWFMKRSYPTPSRFALDVGLILSRAFGTYICCARYEGTVQSLRDWLAGGARLSPHPVRFAHRIGLISGYAGLRHLRCPSATHVAPRCGYPPL